MVEKIVLPNGVRLLCEPQSHVRSCALGLWVESGSRHEPESLCGVSHFIEHMLFKGTTSRDTEQLAVDFDAIGGQVNAFTTKESTCYYVRVLGEYLPRAAELLCDMFFHSTFDPTCVDAERGVILEEIGMYEDTPDDLVNEILTLKAFPGALGRPILGYAETLKAIDSATLRTYRERSYVAANTVVSLCGHYTPADVEALARVFSQMPALPVPTFEPAQYTPVQTQKAKDIEQNHMIVAWPGLKLGADERFAMHILSYALGAGRSSRLYQSVRERAGLCYVLYSFATTHMDTGMFGIYTALGRETEQRALDLILQETARFVREGITPEELDRNRIQLRSSLLMGMEDTLSRMCDNARNELVYGRAIDEEEIIRALDAVTADDVSRLARRLLTDDMRSLSRVGRL